MNDLRNPPRSEELQEEIDFGKQTLRMFSTPPKPPLYARVIGWALAAWWKERDQ